MRKAVKSKRGAKRSPIPTAESPGTTIRTVGKIVTYAVISAFAVTAAIMVLKSTSEYGTGMSPDAVSYVATAEHLRDGKGYLDYDGEPYIQWPPLFPSLLALFGLVGIQPHAAARLINAACFGLVVLSSGFLFALRIRSRLLVVLGTAAVLLSAILLQVSVYAWSEPLFILLLILSVYHICKFLESRRMSLLILAGLCAAMATLQRYVGLSAIIAGGISLMLFLRGASFFQRLKQSATFGLIATVPASVWFIYNKIVAGSSAARHLYLKIAADWLVLRPLNALTVWLVPGNFTLTTRLIIIGVFIAVLITAVVMRCYKGPRDLSGNGFVAPTCLIVIAVYAFFTLSAAAVAGADANDRLWSALYVFFILLVLIGIEAVAALASAVTNREWLGLSVVSVSCAAWLLIYPLPLVTKKLAGYKKYGIPGLNSAFWHHSPLIKQLTARPLEGQLFTNEPPAIYFWTGNYARLTAYRNPGVVTRRITTLDHFKQLISQEEDNYLIWSFKNSRPYLYSPKELSSMFKLSLVAEFPDGWIIRIGEATVPEGLISDP